MKSEKSRLFPGKPGVFSYGYGPVTQKTHHWMLQALWDGGSLQRPIQLGSTEAPAAPETAFHRAFWRVSSTGPLHPSAVLGRTWPFPYSILRFWSPSRHDGGRRQVTPGRIKGYFNICQRWRWRDRQCMSNQCSLTNFSSWQLCKSCAHLMLSGSDESKFSHYFWNHNRYGSMEI